MKSFSILSLVLVAFVAACTAEDESVSEVKKCLQQDGTQAKIKCVADVLGSDLDEAAKKAEQVLKGGTQEIRDFFKEQGGKIHNFVKGNSILSSIHDKLSGLKDKAEGFFGQIKEKFENRQKRQIYNPFAYDFTDTAKACVEAHKDSKLEAIKCVGEALKVKGELSIVQLALLAGAIKDKVSALFNRQKRNANNRLAIPTASDIMVFKKIVTECMEAKNAWGTENWNTKEIMDCANSIAGAEIAAKYEPMVDYIVKHTDAQTIQYVKDQAAKVHDFLNNAAPGFVQSIHEKGHQWYESVTNWLSTTWNSIFG